MGLDGLLRRQLYVLYVDVFMPQKHIFRPPRPFTETALHIIRRCVHASETHL
jgi:hypothetical protein